MKEIDDKICVIFWNLAFTLDSHSQNTIVHGHYGIIKIFHLRLSDYCKTLIIRDDFIFRVNSREHTDAKIKSSLIISNVRVIEEDMKIHENKVS